MRRWPNEQRGGFKSKQDSQSWPDLRAPFAHACLKDSRQYAAQLNVDTSKAEEYNWLLGLRASRTRDPPGMTDSGAKKASMVLAFFTILSK